jgi:hypothetical protein
MEITIPKDFKELLELLNSHNVDYLVVGAYALALHGSPRFTGDLDLYVKPDSDNARRVLAALNDFGFGSLQLRETDLTELDQVIQLGLPPVRIDFLTSLTGLNWEQSSAGSLKGELGGIPVLFLGKKEYIRNKKALGRKKDLADAEVLEKDS